MQCTQSAKFLEPHMSEAMWQFLNAVRQDNSFLSCFDITYGKKSTDVS